MGSSVRHAIVYVLVATLVAACAGSIAATPAPTRSAVASSPRASGDEARCDADAIPGWPKAGEVTTNDIIPVLASSEKVVGGNRLVFALIDQSNKPVASPDLQVQMAFFDLCTSAFTPTESLTPRFAWGIVGERGFYIANPDLTSAGPWGVVVVAREASGTTTSAKIQFSVAASGTTPAIGDQAPAVKTPTLADVAGDVKKISSDPNPDPSLYGESVDHALAAKEPFVLAFATPAFCQSAQCGPTLDVVKAAVKANPIRAINVEPYKLTYSNGRLQPVVQDGSFVPVEATELYGIPSEPWIFVIGTSGRVVASYEAVIAPEELAAAIKVANSR